MAGFIKKEKCLLITALLLSFTSWGRAETILFKDGKNLGTKQIGTATDFYTLQYGMLTVHYGKAPIDKIVLDKSEPKIFFPDPFLPTPVEASIPSDHEVTQACLDIHKKIKDANRLAQLKDVISTPAYQALQQKIGTGAAEVTVLELLKSFMPDRIFITDVSFEEDKAKIAVSGQTRGSVFNGIITMTREIGVWKLDNEVWYGDDRPKALVKNSVKLVDFTNVTENYKNEDLIQWYDPYISTKKNPLGLKRSIVRMPKETFFLFYFVDRDAKKSKNLSSPPPQVEDLPQLHLSWSGSFKTLEQQRLPGTYPLDMTIAQEKDGYMPGRMNLRLPKAKPKGIYIGVLYSF